MKKITILEPGAWGTALGIILSRNNKVSFWYKDKSLARKILQIRENEKLPKIKIPRKILIFSDLTGAIKSAELVVIASPSFNFRKTLLELKRFDNLPPILGIAKGIEKETLKLPSQIAREILPKISYAHLSGPGFAREAARGKEVKEVIASKNKILLKKLKKAFQIKPLKISVTTDLIGVQLAGAMKNSLAIGISLAEATSSDSKNKKNQPGLIKLGLKEMINLGRTIGGEEKTFSGPAGLGDLILTSTDPLSRNFQFGKKLYSDSKRMRKDIKERKITVEGFDTVFALHKLGKINKVNLPMVDEIYKLAYQRNSPRETVNNLMKLIKIR